MNNMLSTTGLINILPLVQQLAAEKPIIQGLTVGYSVPLDVLTQYWPGEWQQIEVTALETLVFTKRYDLAVIALYGLHYDNNPDSNKVALCRDQANYQAVETAINPHMLTRSITRLRDLLARRVLILANPEFTELLRALGFSQIEQISTEVIIWQFNILSYKQVPDWLNSKYWANPENWGKFRW